MASRIGIKDVARHSGVSYKTVSRVVNGERDVSTATRDRVLEAVATLGYRPNHSARSLRRGRTRTLGLLLARRSERFLTEPFWDEVVAGIVDTAARAGYALLLEVASQDDHLAQQSNPDPPGFGERHVDGALLLDTRLSTPLTAIIQRTQTPCVAICNDRLDPAWGSVYADFLGGATRLVEHLVRLGHRRIAHLTGNIRSVSELDRLAGYEQALAAAGIAPDPDLIVPAGHLRHHGFTAMEHLLARRVQFTAVFSVNDLTALGAMERLTQAGLRVPGDVSVVGFDDIYLAEMASPPLTTARLPAYEMGVMATEQLIGALDGTRELQQRRTMPIVLCLRATTSPPPGSS
jgi:DNA-binding LacI/PurR family transcriptional regulator